MNNQLIHRRLWQKEIRQQYPLLMLLLLIVPLGLLLFFVYGALSASQIYPNVPLITIGQFLLGIPCLFAIGISGLLIGQEKETRTIEWLAALPISPQQIVWSKLGSSLSTLLLLWIPCGLAAAIYFTQDSWHVLGWLQGLTFFCFSLYFLTAGLAIQWKLESPLYGVLLLGLAGLIPLGIQESLRPLFMAGSNLFDGLMLCVILLALTLVALFFGFRLGVTALGPKTVAVKGMSGTRSSHREGWGTFLPWDAYQSPTKEAGYRQRYSTSMALLWQFLAQNRKLLLFFSVLLGGVILIFAFNALWIYPQSNLMDQFSSELLPPLGLILSHLVYCWLGVLAFQGDSTRSRIRFLADRGIRPSHVWLSRHLIPGGMIVLFAWIATAVTIFLSRSQFPSMAVMLIIAVIFSLVLLAHGLVSYSCGQWIGQICRSPIMAAILAPIAAWLFLGSVGFCLFVLGTPWWIMAILLALPYLATWMQTRDWMDRTLGSRFWWRHALVLLTLVTLPPAIWGIGILQEPTISRQADREMRSLASTLSSPRHERAVTVCWPLSQFISLELVSQQPPAEQSAELSDLTPRFRVQSQPRDQDKIAWIDHSAVYSLGEIRLLGLEHLERSLANSQGKKFSLSRPAVEFLISLTLITRNAWTVTPADEQSVKIYRRAITAAHQGVEVMRKSLSVEDQEIVNRMEIFLWLELQAENAADSLGGTLYASLLGQLGDESTRRQARLNAVAANYQSLADRGGWYPPNPTQLFLKFGDPWETDFQYRRRQKRGLQDIWRFAQSPQSVNDSELVTRISQSWFNWYVEPNVFSKLPHNASWGSLNDDQKRNLYQSIALGEFRIWPSFLLWHAPWEREAAEALRQLENSMTLE